ncbi:GNAT family N-acetyltransferase [Rhodobium orientis]|uniref:GNAT family N-acetyltransferase n=1 Tax=Rhodobium orientis TaxID=34017 RepID=A0A327JUK5_9HYPH|nr:N-acetyltransferase [Rhodobium orientis]MBK5951191.1 GNAT family N-acetyltransferase [Rhodobium orientis]RAI30230.1 GNAT family N-acetyltransferase [Rhodobium orientis]
MSIQSPQIELESPGDDADIEALHETAFGPGRFARTAFRLREGVPHDPALSFVVRRDGGLVGSVRLTPIDIGGVSGLLLGPLAVLPAFKNNGIGKALVRHSVAAARAGMAASGHRLVLLVGDEPYYGPLGFKRARPGALTLPGPVDPYRLLLAELQEGAADAAHGAVTSGRVLAGAAAVEG